MDAPLRSDRRPPEVRHPVAAAPSHPAERVTHVANPALREAMEETTKELTSKRPFLRSCILKNRKLE